MPAYLTDPGKVIIYILLLLLCEKVVDMLLTLNLMFAVRNHGRNKNKNSNKNESLKKYSSSYFLHFLNPSDWK